MFGEDFYPTPPDLAEEMAAKADFSEVHSILEPSAGKGDLVNGVFSFREKDYRRHDAYYDRDRDSLEVDVIEIDENLRHILMGQKLIIVHDDFLTFETYKRYDLILMNPPFSEGDCHLMKALDLMERGGQIVCLLNAETLRNPHTRRRKELCARLERLGADIEFKTGAFIGAERETDVDIALVYVNIPAARGESVILDHLRKAREQESVKTECRAIIHSDYIDGLIDQYNAEVSAGLALLDDFYAMQPLFDAYENVSHKKIIEIEVNGGGHSHNIRNQFVEAVRHKYWNTLFNSTEVSNKLTSNLQQELHSKVNSFMAYDFTGFNIFQLFEDLSKRTIASVEETIIDLFDEFVRYSMDDKSNVHLYNGWKTNSCYKVGKKVIMPWFRAWEWGKFNPSNYRVWIRLRDIEKVFDFLDARRTAHINIQSAMKEAEDFDQRRKIETKYFYVTFYKKGTCHLEFRNLELLKKFNLFGSQRKNWLPPGYGKKAYQDMDDEERAVIDSYEGRESYEAVMRDREYFIIGDGGQLLAIGA